MLVEVSVRPGTSLALIVLSSPWADLLVGV